MVINKHPSGTWPCKTGQEMPHHMESCTFSFITRLLPNKDTYWNSPCKHKACIKICHENCIFVQNIFLKLFLSYLRDSLRQVEVSLLKIIYKKGKWGLGKMEWFCSHLIVRETETFQSVSPASLSWCVDSCRCSYSKTMAASRERWRFFFFNLHTFKVLARESGKCLLECVWLLRKTEKHHEDHFQVFFNTQMIYSHKQGHEEGACLREAEQGTREQTPSMTPSEGKVWVDPSQGMSGWSHYANWEAMCFKKLSADICC